MEFMTNSKEYNVWRDDFFIRYCSRFDSNKDSLFQDGVISYDHYKNAATKVLFINREAYDDEGGYEVDTAIRVKGYEHWCKSPMRLRIPEFLCIADIVNYKSREEILQMSKEDISMYYATCSQRYKNDLLQAAAYINIKKLNGQRKSTTTDLYQNLDKSADLIEEQIRVINPDIIFAGGIVDRMLECFEPQIQLSERIYVGQSVNVFECRVGGKSIMLFDIIHPSALTAKCDGGISNYYKEVFKAYQSVL